MTQPTTDPLRNLADRAEHHGGLTGQEATALRDGIDQLYREIDTLRAVCDSNKRGYVGAIKAVMASEQRAERAEAALNAVRAELTALNSETAGLNPYAMAGRRDAVARIRAALDAHTNPKDQTCT